MLREIEKHVHDWQDEQTPQQVESARRQLRRYRSTLATADAILAVRER